jgi:hypothetical protein
MSVACWHITGFDPGDPAHLHLIEGHGGPSMICFCPRVTPGQYSVMIGGFGPGQHYPPVLDRLRTRSALAHCFTPDFSVRHRLGCVLDLRTPLENPCANRIFITGDAAWMGQTSNTHAALGAIRAVECCAPAIGNHYDDAACYEPYRAWWKDQYYTSFRMPGANFLEELSAAEIDTLFEGMPAQIAGSLEPRAGARLIGEFFKEYLPGIAARHPGLAGRIVSLQQQPATDVWQRKRAQRGMHGTTVRPAGTHQP